jgi:hypothetical protein
VRGRAGQLHTLQAAEGKRIVRLAGVMGGAVQ